MLTVSPEYLTALGRSHRVTAAASYWQPSGEQGDVLFRIIDGSVTMDRGAQARRALNATLISEDINDPDLDVLNQILQIWLGVDVGTRVEAVSGGVFRIDEIDKGYKNAVGIQGTSLESFVIDDVYVSNVIYPKGMMLLQAIETAISDAYGTAIFEPYEPEVLILDTPLPYDIVAERDRWAVVEALSAIIDCDVYTTAHGEFRVTPKPRMTTASQPVAKLKQGPEGLQISLDDKVARTDTYNGVLAMGQSTDPDIPPVSAFVSDDDPTSPTRWGGPFGKKPYIYENALLTTKEMCWNKALLLLDELRSRVDNVSLSAVPNPALEPGDFVGVDMLDGREKLYMLNQLVIPLRNGAWTGQMATVRDLPVVQPPAFYRTYDTLRRFEPDGVTVITPETYQGMIDDYADYGLALYPPAG